MSALQVSEYFGSGRDPRPLGSAHHRNAPCQAFSARNGDFVLAAGNGKLWRQVCEVLGCMDLYADERFRQMADRVKNQQLLAERLAEIFARWSADDLIKAFRQAGIPCGRINSYSEALADPQVAHMGWVSNIELPGGSMARTFGSPLMIDGVGLPIRLMPPALDADRGMVGRGGSVRSLQPAHRSRGRDLRFPGADFGVVLGIARLTARIGASALEWVEAGREIGTDEALRLGLVDHLASPEASLEVLAREICASTRLDAATLARLRTALAADRASVDRELAELVRSVAEPGLKARMEGYRSRQRETRLRRVQ